MTAAIRAAALGLLVLIFTGAAKAWDAEGHEIIATIAYDHLNPKARQAVDQLAPLLHSSSRTYDAITVACWMDDIRKDPSMPDHGRFLSWHYIDIPIDPRDPMPSFEPGMDNDVHGDIVQALKRAVVVLKGGSDPYIRDQAMALAMVEHLVGDIHQPLHCATKYFVAYGKLRDDKGGNDEFVLNGPPGNAKFNLHAFWDSAYRATFDPGSGNVLIDATDKDDIGMLANRLKGEKAPDGPALVSGFDQWARESNAIARDFVYRDLTATGNAKFCRLGSVYVERAQATAQQRLVLAGYRLATLLNATLGSAITIAPPPSYPAGPPATAY